MSHLEEDIKVVATWPVQDIAHWFLFRNPNVDHDEMKAYTDSFQKFDLDGDQHLNAYEVGKMLEHLGQTKTALEVKRLIADVDMNGDGCINFLEFLFMMKPMSKPGSGVDAAHTELGQITSGLGNVRSFFEGKAAEQARSAGPSNEEHVRAEAALRMKRREEERKAKEEEERHRKEEADRKAAFQAKFRSQFEGGH